MDKPIYGKHPVLEALDSGQTVEKVWLLQGTRGPLEKELRHKCRERQVPLRMVPKARMDREVRSNHQGVIAWLSPIPYLKLEDVLPMIYDKGKTPLVVVAEGITDVRNFGAIARSAELCGAQALVTSLKGGAAVNADAVKASAGALNRLPVCRETSIIAAVRFLKTSGIPVLVSHLDDRSTVLPEADLSGPVAIVLGSEGSGVSPAILREADQVVRIPQPGEGNSFNVSVAAGILLYEVVRQRAYHREG